MNKGARAEYELKEMLEEQGYLVERVAGSGTAKTSICDLIAIGMFKTFLIEVKSTNKPVKYFSKTELERIHNLAKKCLCREAVPVLAVKFYQKIENKKVIRKKKWRFFKGHNVLTCQSKIEYNAKKECWEWICTNSTR